MNWLNGTPPVRTQASRMQDFQLNLDKVFIMRRYAGYHPLIVSILILVTTPLTAATSELASAVEQQLAYQAERCLRQGADPNELFEGEPLLKRAAKSGNFELCRVLLVHGADAHIDVDLGDAFLTLRHTENREQLALELLLRTYRFLQDNARAANRQKPARPGLVILAEPTVDYTHPLIAPHYLINAKERDGRSNFDDDGDGFTDNIYGWGMVADRPHEVNHWQHQLFSDDAALIGELVELHNRTERGELSRLDPAVTKLHTSFRNPIAALFGASYGFTDAKFLDNIVELSHGSHVAGIVIAASAGQAQLHTLSWENFGPYSRDVLGYPPVTDGDPEKWLLAVRKHRFPRLIAIGQRCSDYLRAVDSSVVNASFGISFENMVDRALSVVGEMRDFDATLSTETVTLLANEMYAYDTIPYLIAVAENPEILFVAAAGNDRHNVDASFDAPAFLSRLFPNVISVAAVRTNNELASFSNFGRNSITVAAPGENIESMGIANTSLIMSGTSMSAPAVAGFTAGYRVAHADCDASQLARLIELGATRPDGQPVLPVSSGGTLDESQVKALHASESGALADMAWRLIESNPQSRPEVWADAIELLEALSKEQIDGISLAWARAVTFDQVGMGRQALSDIDRAMALDSARPELWFSKSLILSRMHEHAPLLRTVRDFQKRFAASTDEDTLSFRRDILALGIATAIEEQETSDLADWSSSYRSAVAAVGRADGVGVPVAKADGSQVGGQLRSIRLPADEPVVVHRYLLRSDGKDTVQIDLRSESFDGFLIAVSPSAKVTRNDDFEGQIHHSQIVIDQPEAGEYVVAVTSVGGRETGEYVLDSKGATLINFDDKIVMAQQHRQSGRRGQAMPLR